MTNNVFFIVTLKPGIIVAVTWLLHHCVCLSNIVYFIVTLKNGIIIVVMITCTHGNTYTQARAYIHKHITTHTHTHTPHVRVHARARARVYACTHTIVRLTKVLLK